MNVFLKKKRLQQLFHLLQGFNYRSVRSGAGLWVIQFQ